MAKMPQSDRINSPEGRASYAHVFKARQDKDDNGQPKGDAKFSLVLMIPKDNAAYAEFKAKAIVVGKQAYPNYVEMVKAGRMSFPFRDGDLEDPDKHPERKGHWFFSAKNTNRPQIVDRNGQEITTPEQFGSGDYCRISGRFFAFDNRSKGVAFSLGNIQVLRKGDRLDNRVEAATDFDTVPGGDAPTGGGDFDDI